MPIFEYSCNDCSAPYEILHKSREDADLIECPSCRSRNYTKKFSTFSAAVPAGFSAEPSCSTGSCGVPSYSPCAGGACGLG